MTEVFLPAALQFVLVASVGWVVGNVLLQWVFRGDIPDGVGLPERAVAGVVGVAVFSVTLMIAHVVTGGAIFGIAGVVPAISAVTLVLGIRRLAWPSGVPWFRLLVAAAILAALFLLPAVRTGSAVRTGDPPWHLGWSQQLLAGEAIPTGPAPEFGRNAYPWGYHAVVATTTRIVPGTDPLISHEALHFLFVFALPLSAAALARRVDLRAGWPAAAAVALIGGFGWMQARAPFFAASPRHGIHGADMVVASPNSVYELFPPVFPREFGLLVLAAAGMSTVLAAASRDRRLHLTAGALMGMVGLVSVPMLFTALAWSIFAVLLAPAGVRTRFAGRLFASAALVFGLWAGPVAADYIRFGGFTNVTPHLGMEWPLGQALWSWGLLPFLAAGGIVIAYRARTTPARIVLGFAGATAVTLALAIARGHFDWPLLGNATALHQGRFWPPAHLLGAALAGVAAVHVGRWVARHSRFVAASGALLLLGLGTPSLVYSSLHLTEILDANAKSFVYGSEDFDSDSFVRRAAGRLSSRDVVSVPQSNDLSLVMFQLAGARLADYEHTGLDRNHMRIRFSDLADEWDRQMAAGGFVADYAIVPADQIPAGAQPLEQGGFRGEEWALIPATE